MSETKPVPTNADFGPQYFHGATSNYRGYLRASKLTWLFPYLWMFRRLERQQPTQRAHLDVGCAFGYFLSFAHRPGGRSVGADLSSYAILRAQQLYPTLEFREADITVLPFPDHTFDLITSFHTLEHIPDVAAGVQELSRVLKPGGTLLCVMPYDGVYRVLFGWNDRDRTHVSVLRFTAWVQQFTQAAFHVVTAWRYPTTWGGNILIVVRKKYPSRDARPSVGTYPGC